MTDADCPDDNTLSAFAERAIDGEAYRRVEAHLDTCLDCLAVVSEMARALTESDEMAPTMADTNPNPLTTEEALQRGSVVGRYTILEILGQGGMGTVYLAHDPQLDRRVALKVLRFDDMAPEPRARMTREARLMAKLAHPNIVTVFDAGEVQGRTYIAMELVEGETLASWLSKAPRAVPEILGIYLLAGRALAAAHSAGVVHRDFKPENVLLARSGRVAVTDFGIASSSDLVAVLSHRRGPADDSSTNLTQTGMVLGTPGYMSPEQYRGMKAGPPSDQFSFAVAVYGAIFRQPPFAGSTFGERRDAVLERRFRPLGDEARQRVPPRMLDALLRALSLEPQARFPTLLALLDELVLPAPAPPTAPPARTGKRPLVTALAAAAAVVAIAGLSTLALRSSALHPLAIADAAPPGPKVDTPGFARSGGRTAIVTLKTDNQSGDARYDGVVEHVLGECLSPSTRVDAYVDASLQALARKFEPGLDGDDESFARTLQMHDHRPVVIVRSTLTSDGDGVRISLRATDVASGQSFPEMHETGREAEGMLDAVNRLASRLRTAIGDPTASAESERPALSTSLDALHEWSTGEVMRNTGDFRGALVHLKQAVSDDPQFAEAHAGLGLAQFDLTNVELATKEATLAMKLANRMGKRRRLALIAELYDDEGRSAESISASEQLLSIWPGDLPTEVGVTACALDGGDWTLGLELAKRAMDNHPDAVIAHQNFLLALVANNRFADATREGDDTLQRFPHPSRFVYAFVAVSHELLGEQARAQATCTALEETDPEFADETRADLAIYEGRLDDAAALLRKQIAPAVARGEPAQAGTEYVALADILLEKNDRQGAIAAARAVSEGGFTLEFLSAAVLARAGQEKEATDLAHTWADALGDVPRALGKALEGDLLLLHGKPHDAAQTYLAGLKLRDMWVLHERLGYAHLAEQDFDGAQTELTLCLERQGEGVVMATPSLKLLPRVVRGLAMARAKTVPPRPRAAPAPRVEWGRLTKDPVIHVKRDLFE